MTRKDEGEVKLGSGSPVSRTGASAGEKASSFTTEDDQRWSTSRWELWSFYLFYIGNNGLSGFNFGPSQFQNLLFLAGHDPTHDTFTACATGSECVLNFLGRNRDSCVLRCIASVVLIVAGTVNSIVLTTNGISFAIQAVLFLVIGAWADYGNWRPNITIAFTLIAVAVSFAWLAVEDPALWKVGTILYALGIIAYQGALTFWTAAFPGLARDLPEVRASAKGVMRGVRSTDEHAEFESLQRNRISNVSFAVCSAGEILILAVMVAILKGLHAEDSTENNTRAFSVLVAFTGGVWLLCAIPWFLLEKRRPGLELPYGTTFLTIGFKQVFVAMQECVKLKQTFLYLIFYFLMGDVLNTTVVVVATLQNSVVSYSTLQLTLLLIVGIVTQCIGIYSFWTVQKKYRLSTKTMLCFNVFWIMILTIWGLIGIRTNVIGFKHVWEVWVYQAYYGLMVCPWYAYSQTMISEVSPLSQMFLFFALFSIVGKTSAFVGPFVSSAIIDDAGGNVNMPFAFLFALGAASTVILYFLDMKKSRLECEAFVEAEARREAFAAMSARWVETGERRFSIY